MIAKLSAQEVKAALDGGAVLVDFRLPQDFADAYVPGAVNVQFNRAYPAQAIAIAVPPGSPIVLTSDQDVLTGLAGDMIARTGMYEVRGMLEGGIRAWEMAGLPIDQLPALDAAELHEQVAAGLPDSVTVVDVREPHEWRMGIIRGAQLLPLSQLLARLDELQPGREYRFICAAGNRSVVAASVAARRGLQATNVNGGMNQWMMSRYEMVRPG